MNTVIILKVNDECKLVMNMIVGIEYYNVEEVTSEFVM
jgi:hypothetical protein